MFQSLFNDVLHDMLNKFLFVYLDDILIFSKTKEEHVQHVCLVLQHLLENKLFDKAEKCDFHTSSITFLAFFIQQGHLLPDPSKVKAMVEWSNPSSRKELQCFLGFDYFYHQFIRDYSKVVASLIRLPSTLKPWPTGLDPGTLDPGSWILDPGTLSRMPCSTSSPSIPLVLRNEAHPAFLPTATWLIEEIVCEAQQSHPSPKDTPHNQLFVPESVRYGVLQWGNFFKLTFHPGHCHTLAMSGNDSGGLLCPRTLGRLSLPVQYVHEGRPLSGHLLGSSIPAPYPKMPLVSHCYGFYYWTPSISRSHHHPDCGWPFFKGDPTSKAALCWMYKCIAKP